MNPSAAAAPVEKRVTLVGAGTAHLAFLTRWGRRPVSGVTVTLVNEAAVVPYSAMVPAHVAGDYFWGDITIDLARLCPSVNVRFVVERATGLDPTARRVLFAARPPLSYDVLCVGVGSRPARPAGAPDTSLLVRPLAGFVRELDRLDEGLRQAPRPFHLAVVGGGASGCELALAAHKRLGRRPGFRLTLFQAGARLLPHFPERVAAAFEGAFRRRGIAWRPGARVAGGEGGALVLDGGERVAVDAVLWATRGAPPRLLRDSGLAVDAAGFLRVRDTLQSVADPAVFGTGDCVAFESYPGLPKNGVHAVRQGRVLFDNVAAFLTGRPPRPFRPQRYCLALLNTADGEAVLSYGPLTWKGRAARWLKDRIDRAWVKKLTPVVGQAFQPDTLSSGWKA